MKTFRSERGHIDKVTMTVGELREKLSEYPDEMPILPTWEGIHRGIQKNGFDVIEADYFHKDDNCSALQIDVEYDT